MVDYKEILEEPIFLVNDYLEKGQQELEIILKELKKKPSEYESKAKFLRDYTNFIFNAYRLQKSARIKPQLEEQERQKQELKRQLEIKKQELIAKISSLQMPKAIPQPIKLNKTLQRDLILSKVSNKTLASRKIVDNTYELIEPFLKDEERILLEKLKTQDFNEEKIKQTLQEELKDNFNEETYERLRYHLVRDKLSYGPLSALLEEKNVSEIICNGPNEPLTINIKNRGNLSTNISYLTSEAVNEQINILATKAKTILSEDKPFLDTMLPNKFHVQANLGTEFSKPRFILHK